ncbi:MAG: dihydropteroate synthase [Victivallales bacterium]|nr:dihydropteroate synthase [Victivallales bacterium]
MSGIIKFLDRSLDLSGRTGIMGILNVTPDSFSDGGNYFNASPAVERALEMLEDGADIIDVGGESTRPGADEIPVLEEIRRVVPVIEGIRIGAPGAVISVDTRKSEVARAALDAGADIINDVSGLSFCADMAEVAAKSGAGLIIMHMRGTPQTMQLDEFLKYDDVVEDVSSALQEASRRAEKAGVAADKIIWDPGIGFSKDLEQNLSLLGNIDKLRKYGYAVLGGTSRKAFIGKLLEEAEPQHRVWGTAGSVAWMATLNVELIRVHDVKEMKQLLCVFDACRKSRR